MGKVKRAHVEGRTKEERVKVRKTLGKLKDLTVQPPTRKRYINALAELSHYLQQENLHLPTKRLELDSVLSDYIEHLWATGAGRALASDTLAAVQDKQPQVKGCLQGSWRLLKTWNQNEIPNRAPPLPEPALHAMVGHAFDNHQPLFGLSLLIGFYGMLRTGELLAVKPAHVTQSRDSGPAVVNLGFTKGGKRHGAAESVTLGFQLVTKLIWQWTQNSPAYAPLCPTAQKWRDMFSETLVALKFDTFNFRPYSLRRGGSTFWFQQHGSLDKLLIQGRWASQRTARIYVNEGLALLTEITLPWTKSNKKFLNSYSQLSSNLPQKLERTWKPRRPGGRGGKVKRTKKWAHWKVLFKVQ